MDEKESNEQIDHARRHFLGAAALAVGAAEFGMIGGANAAAIGAARPGLAAVKPGTPPSFGPVKQITAGVLDVGYVEAGPADGRAVILMHGFPYDIHSYVEVFPRPWHDDLPIKHDATECRSGCVGSGHPRLDGCAQDQEGDPGWL